MTAFREPWSLYTWPAPPCVNLNDDCICRPKIFDTWVGGARQREYVQPDEEEQRGYKGIVIRYMWGTKGPFPAPPYIISEPNIEMLSY